jgi:hypothetical protein
MLVIDSVRMLLRVAMPVIDVDECNFPCRFSLRVASAAR